MSGEHTVGAEVDGVRVPERFESQLIQLSELLVHENIDRSRVIGEVAVMLSNVVTEQQSADEVHDKGIFNADRPNFYKRFQPDYTNVQQISETLKTLGHPVVLTSGTYDLLHIGHAKYLAMAKHHGDFLIVGVDSDEKVRAKKGEHRPVAPQNERLQMLSHVRGVDIITLKNKNDPRWNLIRTVHPSTLIATEGTYTEEEISELEAEYVGRVVVLPPQAETSTSARVRKAAIGEKLALRTNIEEALRFENLDEQMIKSVVAKIYEQDG